ncbi:MAG: YdbL family protein [Burkholderiales bacterium]|nr:YdbL family protein [Burkholderiales bacterium]
MQLRFLRVIFICLMSVAGMVSAAADLEINTPAITALKNSMQQRHNQLAPYYVSGAVGLTRDGQIVLRDANAVPLPQRQAVNALVGAENQDRSALYREIARANQHPEWESEIRSTFAGRWIEKAQPGWWVQDSQGGWKKK